MPLIYFVRHGETHPGTEHPLDPPLSPQGRIQAQAVAEELASRLAAVSILTSPLRRCRETASFLAERWQTRPVIEDRVSELPMPRKEGLSRKHWLQKTLTATWSEVESHGETLQPGYAQLLSLWREQLCEAVLERRTGTVIFSHYIPINVLVGRAMGRDTVTCFHPDYASVTVLEVANAEIRVIQRGREMPTRVS